MRLRVEKPAVQRNDVVVTVQQVEVLERLCDEEALLDVILGGIGIVDVFYARVASALDTAMLLQRLHKETKETGTYM